jgi:hypothetical protein
MWESQRLTALWTFTACYSDSIIFYLTGSNSISLANGRRFWYLKTHIQPGILNSVEWSIYQATRCQSLREYIMQAYFTNNIACSLTYFSVRYNHVSRYSDVLQTGRLLLMSSWSHPGYIRTPIQWIPGFLSLWLNCLSLSSLVETPAARF